MSVTVTVRMQVSDVPKAIEGLRDHADLLNSVTDLARAGGALHHRFVAGDGELMVIDEWESAEQFQTFFDSTPQIGEVMTEIGLSGPPAVTVFGAVDAPGTF